MSAECLPNVHRSIGVSKAIRQPLSLSLGRTLRSALYTPAGREVAERLQQQRDRRPKGGREGRVQL